MAPPVNNQNDDTQDWVKRIERDSEKDQRTKPWEEIVRSQPAEGSEKDVVNVETNPQGACDISVSA
ncbi:hypothetical protein IFR05_010215 [Cadophora sp. M221]|nr:hypothetical protein IFR05_010215 [Cadophora sp. M221]